jgi:Holliday junction resolvase
MAQYHRGRDFEHAVRAKLVADGYDVIRSAGSKTKIDLVAFKTSQVLLIQCKVDGHCSPAERLALLRVASLLPNYSVPLIGWKQRGVSQPFFWRLTGTGPHEREPWTPDYLEEVAS